jgi:hypothetical protein
MSKGITYTFSYIRFLFRGIRTLALSIRTLIRRPQHRKLRPVLKQIFAPAEKLAPTQRSWAGVDVMITIFCDFRRKNWRFSQKSMVWSKVCIIQLCSESKCHFFAEFFAENILKIITSVPGRHRCVGPSSRIGANFARRCQLAPTRV